MTTKEAIKIIGRMKPNDTINSVKKLDALMLALSALELADSQEVTIKTGTDGVARPCCPVCPHVESLYTGQRFCSVCGTKLKWMGAEG